MPLRGYLRLLERLDLDFTWLEKEYCCGFPLVAENREKGLARGCAFYRKNMALAREKGAKTLAYCCTGCAHTARQTLADAPEQHIYILDLILDGIRTTITYPELLLQSLRVPA